MPRKQEIAVCPHCGNKTTLVILRQTESIETFYNPENPSETDEITSYYYLVKCKTCKGISLYTDIDGMGLFPDTTHLCYPKPPRLGEGIPKAISALFEEALKIENLSPEAFVMLIRKVLEHICKDQKAKGKNLKEQIQSLGRQGIIPSTLLQMSEVLRLIGNIGAHDVTYKIDFLETQEIKNFIIVILEYVYILPAKVNKLNESIERKKESKLA
jgi:hypothetical protein